MPKKQLPVDSVVVVADEEYDLDEVYRELRIDDVHIVEQLSDQPALYAFWATLSEEANVISELRRRQLDVVEAKLDDQLRQEAREEGEKVTEAVIQRRIVREKEYQEAVERVLEARRDAALLGIIRRALEQRLSALIAINNRDRAELVSTGRE